MPVMDGRGELAERIRDMDPKVSIMIMSVALVAGVGRCFLLR